MGSSELVAAACDYAIRGWPVFPLEPGGKRPLGRLAPHGLKNATLDLEVIRGWWRSAPTANLGLVTGVAFDVLDIDGPDALDRFQDVGPIGGSDVEGPAVATPRGWHCYVATTGRGNTVRLGGLPEVDWRGLGGYVVAPPSQREDGATWSWVTTSSRELGPDSPIVPAPQWVLALFDNRSLHVTGPARHAGRTGFGAAALERELSRLLVAPEGGRNDQLNRSAHALGQLVGGGALNLQEVGDSLLIAAIRTGLGEQEAMATIKSGLAAGLRTPRSPRRVP